MGPRVPGTDFLPDYVAFAVLALVSVVIAIVWSVIDRRRQSYPRAFPWVYTAVRFILAALMFWYGWGKILPGQFGLGVEVIYLPPGLPPGDARLSVPLFVVTQNPAVAITLTF